MAPIPLMTQAPGMVAKADSAATKTNWLSFDSAQDKPFGTVEGSFFQASRRFSSPLSNSAVTLTGRLMVMRNCDRF